MQSKWLLVSEQDIKNNMVKLYHHNRFPIRPGDEFIFAIRMGEDNLRFVKCGLISSVKEPTEIIIPHVLSGEQNGVKKTLRITTLLLESKDIGDKLTIKDLYYSLHFTSRRNTSFNGQIFEYIRISKFDFETITNANIFMARTVFAKIINSIPLESRYDFILCMVEGHKVFDLRRISYDKALHSLFDFIDYRLKCPGDAIVQSSRILKDILAGQDVLPENIGIYDEKSEMCCSMVKQADRIEHLIKQETNKDLRSEIFNYIEQNKPSELRFEKEFFNAIWPVNL